MKNTLVIIHFQPLEKYPPVCNLLNEIAGANSDNRKVHVITSAPATGTPLLTFKGVNIHRLFTQNPNVNRVYRLLSYLKFYFTGLLLLIRYKPGKILYYETLSAGSPWLYKKIFGKRVDILIHYHEYTSPEEYQTGMALSRWLHKKELTLFPDAQWVSHTNEDRLKLFVKDIEPHIPPHLFLLPNHPPASWQKGAGKQQGMKNGRIGFVYVGALSLESMYFRQAASFIASYPNECFWDIYSDNYSDNVIDYLTKLAAANISFKGSVIYNNLPETLVKYDVGLILYNGHIPNYIFNAPNKLFEYHVCGLNVWFPNKMKSCYPYVKVDSFPQIIPVDFDNPSTMPALNREEQDKKPFQINNFSSEEELKPLLQQLFQTEG